MGGGADQTKRGNGTWKRDKPDMETGRKWDLGWAEEIAEKTGQSIGTYKRELDE